MPLLDIRVSLGVCMRYVNWKMGPKIVKKKNWSRWII